MSLSPKSVKNRRDPRNKNLYPILDDLHNSSKDNLSLSDSAETNLISESSEDLTDENSSPQIILESTQQSSNSSSGNSFYTVATIFVIITVFGFYFVQNYGSNIIQATNEFLLEYDKKNCSDLLELEKHFSEQGSQFWREILVQIEHVQNDIPPQPAVILFVTSNQRKSDHIIQRIIEVTATCLNSRGGALLLKGEDFQHPDMIKDFGILIPKYIPELETRKVMHVNDISGIPASVVPAFHVLCDKFTPAVKKSMIYFTLEIDFDEIANASKGQLYDIVETKLTKLWKTGMRKDKIQPLIARMTDSVLHVKTR